MRISDWSSDVCSSDLAAHSGVNIESGVNAVSEAARKIIALEALSDPDSGITVNAGMVQGGSAFNIVAPSALLEAEVRYRNSSDRAGLLSAIRETASRSFIKGTVDRKSTRLNSSH